MVELKLYNHIYHHHHEYFIYYHHMFNRHVVQTQLDKLRKHNNSLYMRILNIYKKLKTINNDHDLVIFYHELNADIKQYLSIIDHFDMVKKIELYFHKNV